jgi:hypothetical protein
MAQLAREIELLSEHDRNLVEENARVERLRARGAAELYGVCRAFADSLNHKLSRPAVVLDPVAYTGDHYRDGVRPFFQINLRGRLVQVEFEATEELYGSEEFRKPHVLRGAVRSFNQDFLDHNNVDEKSIFYCADRKRAAESGQWHFFDSRTYRTGELTEDFFIGELRQLL